MKTIREMVGRVHGQNHAENGLPDRRQDLYSCRHVVVVQFLYSGKKKTADKNNLQTGRRGCHENPRRHSDTSYNADVAIVSYPCMTNEYIQFSFGLSLIKYTTLQ